jgi:hypothetical protein
MEPEKNRHYSTRRILSTIRFRRIFWSSTACRYCAPNVQVKQVQVKQVQVKQVQVKQVQVQQVQVQQVQVQQVQVKQVQVQQVQVKTAAPNFKGGAFTKLFSEKRKNKM